MIYFACVATILLCIVLWRLLRPLWQEQIKSLALPDAEQQTLSILREQRRDLDAEFQAGHIGQSEYEENIEALALRLAEETMPHATSGHAAAARQPDHRSIAASIIIGITAASVLLYAVLGNTNALDPRQRAPVTGITPEQIAEMIGKLEEKVSEHPDDAQARLMLARSYMILGRFQDAALSYEKLNRLHPHDAEVLSDWADAVANAEGGRVSGKAEQLIAQALKIDPDNIKALALSGSAAFDRKDYTQAISLWERMSTHVDPQSETGKSARAMIAEAQHRAAAQSTDIHTQASSPVTENPNRP